MVDPIHRNEDNNQAISDPLDLENLSDLEGLINAVPDEEIPTEFPDEQDLRQLENDGLGRYFKKIGSASLLTREQEFWLGIDVQVGRKAAQLNQLLAGNPVKPSFDLLRELLDELKASWMILSQAQSEKLVSEFDWGWLASQIVSQRAKETNLRPDNLFFWMSENVSRGDQSNLVARHAINFFFSLLIIPAEILLRVPWNLERLGDEFSSDLVIPTTDQSLIWDLEHLLRNADQAKESLVLSNLRLVISVARKYRGRGLDFDDLIQYGNLGLMRSIEKFDPCSGYRFSTYSYWWIMQSVTRALADYSRTIRLPVHLHDKISSIKKVQEVLFQKYGRNPTIEEIMDEHGNASRKDVVLALIVIKEPLSLDETTGGDDDSVLEDFIPDSLVVEDRISDKLLREMIDEVLDKLPPRERKILELRYGLAGDKPQTLEEVGQKMGVTRERIRQIEDQALSRLRVYPEIRRGKLDGYIKG